MAAADIVTHSAHDIAAAVRERRLTAAQVTDAFLDRIQRLDGPLHAFLTVAEERSRLSAARVDALVRSGRDPGPLAGVPVAVKDNISTRGLRTTCGSRILEEFVPLFDATAVGRLEAAGAIVIGKTNLDEFGMGSSTEHSAFGPTRNPWNLSCVPGGSSGGSAAAVAAGLAPVALGTDTGGSVRQPGAFCGLVALKPHYGTGSRYGLVAFASSLEGIGPMAQDAADCACLWNLLQGADTHDSTSLAAVEEIVPADLDRPVKGLRLGLPSNWLAEGLDERVRASLNETIRIYNDLGVEIAEVDLPDPKVAISTYYIIANAEASSNLARYDGVRYGRRASEPPSLEALYKRSRAEGFGAEVKRRVLLGTFVLSSGYYDAYYLRAQRVRQRLREQVDSVLARYDALLLPTSPTPPFRIGEKLEDPLTMYLSDVYTILPNLLQGPAVSFPGQATADGLPVGLQLYGRARDEATLLHLVRAHEKVRGVPPLAGM